MSGASSLTLSILMIAGLALAGGGAWLAVGRRDVRKGLLMLLAAAVTFANALIWTL